LCGIKLAVAMVREDRNMAADLVPTLVKALDAPDTINASAELGSLLAVRQLYIHDVPFVLPFIHPSNHPAIHHKHFVSDALCTALPSSLPLPSILSLSLSPLPLSTALYVSLTHAHFWLLISMKLLPSTSLL
jgi:hypothetical protein